MPPNSPMRIETPTKIHYSDNHADVEYRGSLKQ